MSTAEWKFSSTQKIGLILSGTLPGSWDDIVLPVDKPRGISSFDVIRRLRRLTGVRKIGHAGTLDPMATGLLICLIGRATKKMNVFLEMPKVYEGRIRLGQSTPSFDAETPVSRQIDISDISDKMIQTVARTFEGTIRQKTPMYSAVRVGGERLYKKARRGEKIDTPLRDVTIGSFQVSALQGTDVSFRLVCSKGTYVRTIAHDLGQNLGVGAHLIALRRTMIGKLHVDAAWNLNALAEALGTPEERVEPTS